MRRRKSGWVYFIQETMTQCIKIGTSVYPLNRIGGLQVGNPYQLVYLGDIPGGIDVEASLHHRFRKHRMKGEWFGKAIALSVKEMICKDGDPCPSLFFVDWPSETVEFDRLVWMAGATPSKVREWFDGVACIKGSNRKLFARADAQERFGRLRFMLDEEQPGVSDETRQKLLGIEMPAQVSLYDFAEGSL